MPFVPRLRDEVRSQLAAYVVATSKLTDVSEGSVMLSILGAVAEEAERIEFRLKTIRDGYSFKGVVATDVDDRLGDLPPSGQGRLGPSVSAGPVMKITRKDAVGVLNLNAGTVYGRSDNADVRYIQTQTVSIPNGQLVWPDPLNPAQSLIDVVATIRGSAGNADKGAIDRMISPVTGIASVTNDVALTGGLDRESDAEAIKRAITYLSSLARSQPIALQFLALSFVSSVGLRLRHAKLFEDPTRAGYSELIIDDGTGLAGYGKKGAKVSGVVPTGDTGLVQTVIYHEGPATDPILNTGVTRFYINGAAAPNNADGTPRWVSIPERGVLYPDAGLLVPGDTWEITNYNVYTGPILELQRLIEGDPSDPLTRSGWRASGTRVRVTPPLIQKITPFQVNIVVYEGVDTEAMKVLVKAEVVAFAQALGPGEPLFLAGLYAKLMALPGMRNVTVKKPAGDSYPASARHVLRVDAASVEII